MLLCSQQDVTENVIRYSLSLDGISLRVCSRRDTLIPSLSSLGGISPRVIGHSPDISIHWFYVVLCYLALPEGIITSQNLYPFKFFLRHVHCHGIQRHFQPFRIVQSSWELVDMFAGTD